MLQLTFAADPAAATDVLLIDGNNLAHRAYHALPPDLCNAAGEPTGALVGFANMLLRLRRDYAGARFAAVAWDLPGGNWRKDAFGAYKAQRARMAGPLAEQWDALKQLARGFGFAEVAQPGHEADDVLATLARQAAAGGHRVVIVTSDRDMLQAVDGAVSVLALTKGVSETRLYTPAAVEERFGVPPALMPDLAALRGDSSDNIPGVPGIGAKTAAALLQQHGSLEAVLAAAGTIGGKRGQALAEHAQQALLSRRLVTLTADLELPEPLEQLLLQPAERAALEALCDRYELDVLRRRLGGLA